MNTHSFSSRWFTFILLAVGLASLLARPAVAAGDEARGTLFETVFTQPGLTEADVQAVIIRSLNARRWTVQSKDEGVVVGHLVHRGTEATLTLVYDSHKVEMYYTGWKVDKSGRRIEPEVPERWLKNMQKDLTVRLNPAAAVRK